jgi:hypothetical protein
VRSNRAELRALVDFAMQNRRSTTYKTTKSGMRIVLTCKTAQQSGLNQQISVVVILKERETRTAVSVCIDRIVK